jgi:hypothetical protein
MDSKVYIGIKMLLNCPMLSPVIDIRHIVTRPQIYPRIRILESRIGQLDRTRETL